jgi:hypothetical protein
VLRGSFLWAYLATALHSGDSQTDFRVDRDSQLLRTDRRCFNIPRGAARFTLKLQDSWLDRGERLGRLEDFGEVVKRVCVRAE